MTLTVSLYKDLGLERQNCAGPYVTSVSKGGKVRALAASHLPKIQPFKSDSENARKHLGGKNAMRCYAAAVLTDSASASSLAGSKGSLADGP